MSGPSVLVRRGITVVVFVIAGLSFAFGFGNGWALGLQLGVSGWIAPLVAPAVDLSVVALLASVQYLRTLGVSSRLVGPRLLLVTCGLITFALNTARPILARHVGRACFDAVAPLLLIGWGEVGPWLLTALHQAAGTVQDETGTVPDRRDEGASVPGVVRASPGPSPELVAAARQVASVHREATGRAITRDGLRAQMKVSNAVAGELIRIVRAAPGNGSGRVPDA